jgi:hypothetical protein
MDDVGKCFFCSFNVIRKQSCRNAIMDAAMEAAGKLGISLEQVDEIAGSLLDFESSICSRIRS